MVAQRFVHAKSLSASNWRFPTQPGLWWNGHRAPAAEKLPHGRTRVGERKSPSACSATRWTITNMTTKKLHSNEIAPGDAPQSPTSDAGRSDAPALLVARHPGLRALEAVLRDLTRALKETDLERGRRTSLTATDCIAGPDADALRGFAEREALHKAHESRYGTPEEKAARRAAYQQVTDQLHRHHPTWSYEELLRQAVRALRKEGLTASTTTLKRYIGNPRKKT
jgi:hypothetical protein